MKSQENREKIIEIKNLMKTYKSRTQEVSALQDISLHIFDGEFITVVGPSGCGKSTLLRIIAGLIPKTSGDVYVCNAPVTGTHSNIGIVFQTPNLLPWRNVIKNVMLTVEIYRLDKKKYFQTALNLLELAGLKGFEYSYPHELSGGMQQRVSLCRALISAPPILLMDEPFGALDALTREKMNIELLKIWDVHKKTVFFITHNIFEAIFLGDRVVVMTPRPGMVEKVIPIDLPRPRTIRTKKEKNFIEYELTISEMMGLA